MFHLLFTKLCYDLQTVLNNNRIKESDAPLIFIHYDLVTGKANAQSYTQGAVSRMV